MDIDPLFLRCQDAFYENSKRSRIAAAILFWGNYPPDFSSDELRSQKVANEICAKFPAAFRQSLLYQPAIISQLGFALRFQVRFAHSRELPKSTRESDNAGEANLCIAGSL
jgi:hypothetical protein